LQGPAPEHRKGHVLEQPRLDFEIAAGERPGGANQYYCGIGILVCSGNNGGMSLRKLRLTRIIATAIIFVLGACTAGATTVYFNDANRGPADTLQIGPVTVADETSGWGPHCLGGQPATVSGAGLGINAGIGPIYEINQSMTISTGQGPPAAQSSFDGVSVSMNSPNLVINSITLVPDVSLTGPGGNVPVPANFWFPVFARLATDPLACDYQIAASSSPVTLGASLQESSFTLVAQATEPDENNAFVLECANGVMQAYGLTTMTVEVGVAIQSLDYSVIPEPGANMLLGMGLLGLFRAKRRQTRHHC
jgi:hypothetical protein